MRDCPCRNAKNLISSVLKLVDFWEDDDKMEAEQEEDLKKGLVLAARPFKRNRQKYDNYENTIKK